MMGKQAFSLNRLTGPDEDGLIRFAVHAQNEMIAASGEAYTSPQQLIAFAEKISTFPNQFPDSVAFSAACGSYEISIRLETLNSLVLTPK